MSLRRFPLLPPLALLLAATAFAGDPPSGDAAASATAAPVDLAAPKGNSDDVARQLSDTQDKLSTALHSYTLLQDENAQLKADAEKSAADKASLDTQLAAANNSIALLKSQAAAATQVDGLRDQLRQSQNQIAALATENADLRTRLALTNSAPTGPVFPLRPSRRRRPARRPPARTRHRCEDRPGEDGRRPQLNGAERSLHQFWRDEGGAPHVHRRRWRFPHEDLEKGLWHRRSLE